ncbi:MAG: alpha/beta-hydrolase, partial [Ramlibacter sp.]|nr:alpha/beta-hydrolase [Ramlibacter sp.]
MALLLAGCSTSGPKLPVPVHDQTAIASRGFFYVGGQYRGEANAQTMSGQIYVEVLAPKVVRRPYPLVLIHGAAQTATNWMGTPDGRKGWAEYFVEQGYVVYMIDQPMRGRSAWHPADGKTRMYSAQQLEQLFTSAAGNWPQAKLHTQWPGEGPLKGKPGDPIFDAFYATQVESLASNVDSERYNQLAGAALLDRIGPAIVLTHSQSGPFGWLIADARPSLVKGVIAIEPTGPPFENSTNATGKARPWGLTEAPIAYEPAVTRAEDLKVQREAAESSELFACWMQQEPARQLLNLKNIPIMVMSTEASYHAVYDHCTAKYLQQAGVRTDYIRLKDTGMHGNGHMVM